jgi:hypothetical protein
MILFKKQLFDLDVKGQGPMKVITVRDTPPYNGAKLGRKHLCKVSKPDIDGPWVCPFQIFVRQPHPPFKMAAVF